MFSFHKPKIYRSISGCCICRAKSSSSRFTDSKKYETEFEKCFRIAEKRAGEICNACVLLVKRWKKLPTGTSRNWHHVVDARAGPGTKSFKNKSMCGDKKRPFGKPNRNISALCSESKVRHQSMTSSESESDEDDDEMIDDLDSLVDSPSHSVNGQRSLRRSNRLNLTPGSKMLYKNAPGSATDRNNNLNGTKSGMAKRRSLKSERFFSFLDTSFWQEEKVCCGIIFKGPNNEVIIYPELLNPCGGCRKPQPFSLSTNLSSSSSECESVSRSSSSTSLTTSKPPSLVSISSVSVPLTGTIVSSPSNCLNSNISLSQVKSLTEPNLSLTSKKALQHQDSFTNSDTFSEPGSSSGSSQGDTDEQSSGISSMAACDETTMMMPDSDLSLALSDRLSTVSSVCLMMDVDDASSNASTATYDGLSHHELEMSSEDSPVKNAPDSVVFSATAVV